MRLGAEHNYAFKPTAENGLSLSCCASRGGGLTRRWTACKAVRLILRTLWHSPFASFSSRARAWLPQVRIWSASCAAHRASLWRSPAQCAAAHAEHPHASLGGRFAQVASLVGASASEGAVQVWHRPASAGWRFGPAFHVPYLGWPTRAGWARFALVVRQASLGAPHAVQLCVQADCRGRALAKPAASRGSGLTRR